MERWCKSEIQKLATLVGWFESAQETDWSSVATLLGTDKSSEECRAFAEFLKGLLVEWSGVDPDIIFKRKRFRRRATSIQRKWKCYEPNCQKAYGTEGALKHHIKVKHPNLAYDREKARVKADDTWGDDKDGRVDESEDYEETEDGSHNSSEQATPVTKHKTRRRTLIHVNGLHTEASMDAQLANQRSVVYMPAPPQPTIDLTSAGIGGFHASHHSPALFAFQLATPGQGTEHGLFLFPESYPSLCAIPLHKHEESTTTSNAEFDSLIYNSNTTRHNCTVNTAQQTGSYVSYPT